MSAIVTGAAGGIGRAIAGRLAADGLPLLLVDLDPAVEAVAAEVGGVGLVADLRTAGFADQVVAAAREHFGRVTVLVNNAAVGPLVPFTESTPEQLEEVMVVNFRAVQELCRAAVPALLEAGGGAIVNLASLAGLLGYGRLSSYAASKGAVIALTRTLAVELGRQGIRCNAVAPGATRTPALRRLTEEQVAARLGRVPLGRLGEPEDVANAVAFLASPQAAYITGQVLCVDGGSSAWGGF
jgi:NAD(P)-dependent dehydrogenase (short-subunit alcohol dehydrogenase family)